MKRIISMLFIFSIAYFMVEAQETKKRGDVFFTVEEMPEYPGGKDSLRNDLARCTKYPVEAKEKGIAGKVYVTFVVNEEGKVEDAKIARGVDPLLDNESLRVVNALKSWKPGKEKGKPVKVSYTVPINFQLDDCHGKKENKKLTLDGDPVFFIVEEMPEYPGGQDSLKAFISKNLKYPAEAVENNIQGKVYVSFTVAKDGSVKQSKIARGVHHLLDKEAIRVVESQPVWKPGKQRGKNVNVRYTIPINFALN